MLPRIVPWTLLLLLPPLASAQSPPAHWHLFASQPLTAGRTYVVALDHGVVHSGTGSGRLQSLDTPVGHGTLAQWSRSGAFRGRTVCFSAWLQSRDVTGWGGLWFRADDAQGNVLEFQNAKTRRTGTNTPFEGSTDWHQVELYIDIPENAVALGFGVVLVGSGTVWIDDAAIEILGPAAAAETTFTPVLAHNPPPRLDLMSDPANLDFEQ